MSCSDVEDQLRSAMSETELSLTARFPVQSVESRSTPWAPYAVTFCCILISSVTGKQGQLCFHTVAFSISGSSPIMPLPASLEAEQSAKENCAKNLFSTRGKPSFTRHPSLIKLVKSIENDRRKISSAPSSPVKSNKGMLPWKAKAPLRALPISLLNRSHTKDKKRFMGFT